ncbi:unnamed protein product [Discosporangium mesarthrocarpum]
MTEALPDDPVARAKAIALKLTATAAPTPAPEAFTATAGQPAPGYAPSASAPAQESELGKRKKRWGEDTNTQSATAPVPTGFGLPAALMTQATAPPAQVTRNKLMVPREAHPDFNFMGVLIGPKGSSMKAMEQRTGAKILIRGRGSQKDQNPNDPDANEEMHVVVEGSDQAVALASEEIENIFKDPQRALTVKNEQLKTLNSAGTAVNGSSFMPSGAGTYGQGGGDTEEYSVEMAVPNTMVGLIIGRQGSNIQAMQRDYQITIQITSQNDLPPGAEMRPVKLKGNRQSVETCRNQITQIVTDRERELAGGVGTSGSMGGDSHYGPGSNGGPQATNHLTIPDDKVGLVIGKGGGTIKGVQARTGANIQIPPEADATDRSKRTIAISASTKEAADRAMAEVQNILSADAAAMGQTSGVPPGSQVLYVVIPDDKVGLIIGKGGSTIKEMQNRTGCRIQIPQQVDPGSNPATRRVTLTGVGDAPHNAKRDIEMMVLGQGGNGRGFGGGGPPPHHQYGAPPQGQYGPPPGQYAPPPHNYYGAPPPHQHAPYQPAPYHHQPPPPQQQPYYGGYQQPPPQQYAQPDPYQQQPQQQAQPQAQPQTQPQTQQPQQPQQQTQQQTQQPQEQQPQQPQQQPQTAYYQQPAAPAPAHVQAPAPAAQTPAPGPAPATSAVDMTQYYDQFWQYAAYYGEQVAREQYGAWAPPVGTPPPPGINIPGPGQANPPPTS